jgi:hypothetical protein
MRMIKIVFIVSVITLPMLISLAFLATNDARVKKGIQCLTYSKVCDKSIADKINFGGKYR